MAYDQLQVQRARFAIEDVDASESNFAADLTGDIASNFRDLRHEPLRIMRSDMVTEDTTVVQRDLQRRNHVLGPERATTQVVSFWCGTNEAITPSVVSPTPTTQNMLFSAVFGGYHADSGSTVAASPSPTTTTATVETGEGARFVKGQIAAIGSSAATALPVLITNVSTDALTWWPALPAAPGQGDVVYGAQTIYCDTSSRQTIQVLAEMAKQRGNIWLGLGGWPTGFSMDWSRGQLAKWTLDLQFAKYLHDDEMATPIGAQPISEATYDGTGPAYSDEGGCILTSDATRTLVKVSELSVNFGGAAARFEIGQHSGVEGLGPPERNTREPITIEVTLLTPGDYEVYHDAYKAEIDYGIMFWISGGGAGKGRVFAAPTCQIIAPPEPTEAFGMEGLKLTLMAKENARTTSGTTAQHLSPFYLGHY